MKAIVLKRAGDAEALSLEDVSTPSISRPDQVLVKLKAASVNPIDTKIRQAPERFPVAEEKPILGCDGAGIVESVGADVSAFKPGDEVYFCQCGFNGRQGTYGEYALVDQIFLAHKPNNLSFEEAAAAPLVLITAWEALYDRAHLQLGDTVLIHAGAGGVGHVAIQLAKIKGARVAVTVSTEEKAEFAKSLGADLIIMYKDEPFVDAINAWTNGTGVDIVFDTVGGSLIEESFAITKVYGDLVTILGVPPNTDLGVARKRNIRITQELMLTPTMMELEDAKFHQGNILKQAAELFQSEKLSVKVATTLPLEQTAQAHKVLENNRPIGKVVITI